ncbi:plant glycogenin-like starch initiation protein [Striga asiatica]|uniref:Hexosyltransferase n=1 Tax=Striga asiatica TaxID=4170 RepID=A0A5A7QFL2_STRAF|nr:plant glycogenin-like starch initiation protein [Striga asiatica]
MVLKKLIKSPTSKSLILRINLIFLSFFLLLYIILLLCPSASDYHERAALYVRCSLRECRHKENGIKMKAMLEDGKRQAKSPKKTLILPKLLEGVIGKSRVIGTVGMEGEELSSWGVRVIPFLFERVSNMLKWKHIFPEWIDEEEEYSGWSCPEIQMPDFEKNSSLVDVIVAKLPCKYPEEGWNRDVFRLQAHLAAVNVAVKRGRRDDEGRVKVVVWSSCMPMIELFRCEERVGREGDWWEYWVQVERLAQKIAMPMGSCALAMPLWDKGINRIYDISPIEAAAQTRVRREAYATVLHSSESYVCGAITLAQSLLRSGTHRDLILLLDLSISEPKRAALAQAGWTLRFIHRIRNPRAEKNSYNEYNYSKFRLWQLTDYDKVIFIDSDIIVLRNLDILFQFPQMSATGNDASIFNSGIMVIEPSNCTFDMLMQKRKEIVSYNGGDQGFLNEVFVWWHRLPRRVNFLKNFWSNSSTEAGVKNQLLGSDPPKLYSIHYLGLKPWNCYRDYDCNWDVWDQHVYASDVAHATWWKLHDAMDARLQSLCNLSKRRKIELQWDRKLAARMGFANAHWRINITDPRRFG